MNQETYSDFVNSRFKRIGPFAGDILHAAVGMVGEWGEMMQAMSRENFLEELGDFDFYLTQARLLVIEQGVRFDEQNLSWGMQLDQNLIAVRNHSIEILDLAKKGFIYNKDIPALRYQSNLEALDKRISFLAEFMGSTREAIRITNVNKLLKRYPDGYSDAAAQARADKRAGE